MPLCVHCAYPSKYLYTTYKTKSNIRLSVCKRCDRFADPLIEHDPLILILDLILLKPRVFLHLLYNKGAPSLDATAVATPVEADRETSSRREQRIRNEVVKLFFLVVIAERISRNVGKSQLDFHASARSLWMVTCELFAQHAVTLRMALLALRWKGWYPQRRMDTSDGRQQDFIPWLIPLTLLYTSLIPLLLQLFLSIWYTPPTTHTPPDISSILNLIQTDLSSHPGLQQALLEVMNLWNNSDRVWIGTKLLGGMSAGFGLRVLLPTRPWETTAIVLAGWGAAAFAGYLTG